MKNVIVATLRNVDNENKIKEYCDRKLRRKAESTVSSYEKSIEKFQKFFGYRDFRGFDFQVATQYVDYLREQHGGSLNTINTHLKNLKKFLEWLSDESGYEKLSINDILDGLTLKNNEINSLKTFTEVDYPKLEETKTLFDSIEVKTDIDRRDKALIAFMVATGMRIEAITTLTMKAVDIDKMFVNQTRKNKMRIKYGKNFKSKIFNFDSEMTEYFVEWYKYLKAEKHFSDESPVFPRSKQSQEETSAAFIYEDIDNKRWESTSPINKVLKDRSKAAGVTEFSAHKFRHLSIHLALRRCRAGIEVKAISQNFGHEYAATTMQVYGNLPNIELIEALDKIDKGTSLNIIKDDKLILEIIKEVMLRMTA